MTELTEAELDAWEAEARAYSPLYVASVDILKLIDAARASLSPWRPISEAPRDGTEILLFCPYEYMGAGFWYKNLNNWRGGWRESGFKTDSDGISPTHWMPLPNPPPLTATEIKLTKPPDWESAAKSASIAAKHAAPPFRYLVVRFCGTPIAMTVTRFNAELLADALLNAGQGAFTVTNLNGVEMPHSNGERDG